MKVTLHIGQSKTGTSAIQAYLTLNRRKLAEQQIFYPAVIRKGMEIDMGNHNSVADAVCGVMKFPYVSAETFFSQAFSEAEKIGATRMILSAEHFFGGEPRVWNVSDHNEYFGRYRQKVEALARHLRDHETQLLVYLRPQAHWFASAISQTIRIQGLISDRQIYENDRQFFEMAKPLLQYHTLLEIWRDALRPETIEVVPYHSSMLREGSIIPDFIERLQLQETLLPYAHADIRVNESLTRECLEVKKIFNQARHSKSAERVAIRCLVQLSREHGGSTVYQPCQEVLEDVKVFVAPENAALQRRFGVPSDILDEAPRSTLPPIPAADVEEAWGVFKKRFGGLRGRLMIVDDVLRANLRNHAPVVHGLLHQLKMLLHRRRYQLDPRKVKA